MVEENIAVARAFFDALNAHNLDAMDALRTRDFESEASVGRMSFERNRRYNKNLITAFPDLHFEINLVIAQDDYVSVVWSAVGSHNGIFRTPSGVAIPATGREAKMTGNHTFEIKEGRIAHTWFFTDMASLLTQLGLMPAI